MEQGEGHQISQTQPVSLVYSEPWGKSISWNLTVPQISYLFIYRMRGMESMTSLSKRAGTA